VAEARELESEMQRMREENAELRKRLGESSSLEAAKKKAEAKAEQLQQKVCSVVCISRFQ
jgi:homeobox protein cut-like